MSRVCYICGRGPQVGNRVSHAHNVTKRRFEINLQTMRIVVNGHTKRVKVCTRCIQAGKIVRPRFQPRERKVEALEAKRVEVGAAEVTEEEKVSRFFSETSIVDTVFKRKKRASEETETEAVETPVKEESEAKEEDRVDESSKGDSSDVVEAEPVSEADPAEPEPEAQDQEIFDPPDS